VLTVTTTHLKIGWIRRNGIPRSDRATLVEHWIRHGAHLTLVSIVNDPVYLTEPFVRSTDFMETPRQQIDPYPCESVVEVPRAKGEVPAHLPGANPFLTEFRDRLKLPANSVRGGAQTMYPEYRAGFAAAGGDAPKPLRQVDAGDGQIHVLPVQNDVYMLVGAGGNIAVQAGKDGVVVVNAGDGKLTDKVLAAVKTISSKPIRYVVDTSADASYTGGNEAVAKAGTTITGGNVASGNANWPATIVAHENVTSRMSAMQGKPGALPAAAWPEDVYFGEQKDMFVNGEPVQLFSQPAAHSDGDSLVFFRRSDVVVAGDLFSPDRYPAIDVANGGGINGVVDALNHILDLTVPAEKQEGGTYVIPGHGRLCDEADVLEYRDMVTIVRERIQDMIKRGMTLEQVKAAKPTRDYDPLYGSTAVTPDQFVEAAYRSLKK